MNKDTILKQTAEYIKTKLSGESSGHDWWHVYRVWKNAVNIAQHENADLFTIELASLLHDISDWKLNDGDVDIGPRLAREWLAQIQVEENIIDHVCEIIKEMSFKGAGVKTPMRTIEGLIVQDADRLDAMGAIGIARTFAYGGHRGREMHNPAIPVELHDSFEKYKNDSRPSINHFYEKLLLLKDLMNTETAKKIAEQRHLFMERYLTEFFSEWEGKS